MINLSAKSVSKYALVGLGFLIIFGIGARFWQIQANNFFYYDEGMYLTHNIGFLDYMESNPPENFKQIIKYLEICMHVALADGKALWFFIANLRGFFIGVDAWYFTRLVSAVFGVMTLFLTYVFARRYYDSKGIGLLALGLLAVYPSHVYYSRLGIQESLSMFCFLAGLYFYIFPKKFCLKTVLSGFLFSLVFFSNYRMIVIPALVFFTEAFCSFAGKKSFDIRKYVYNTLAFLFVVFMVGNIDQGANTKITFAWMFYQKHLAATQGKMESELFNYLAYPYFIFKLETILFGLFFIGNLFLIYKKQWEKLFPFALACFHMLMFSFVLEKSLRFLCVVMPMIVMAAAGMIAYIYHSISRPVWKGVVIVLVGFMLTQQIFKTVEIAEFQADYESSMIDLKKSGLPPAVLSSQFKIQEFFVMPRKLVMALPHQINHFVILFQRGYGYIVIDPQAYVSYTQDKARFSEKLEEPLDFILKNVPPKKIYDHFSDAMLERFVLEHNVNLRKSLAFLRSNQEKKFGKLYVYDLKQSLSIMAAYMKTKENNK